MPAIGRLSVALERPKGRAADQPARPVLRNQGVEDGESWSEGGQSDSAYTSSMPAGRYVLRLEGQWEKWQLPAVVTIRIEQNVTRGFNLLIALIVISIGPVIMVIYHIGFERRRWSESMFGGGDDDDDE